VAAWAEPADDEQVTPAVTSAIEGRDGREVQPACATRRVPGRHGARTGARVPRRRDRPRAVGGEAVLAGGPGQTPTSRADADPPKLGSSRIAGGARPPPNGTPVTMDADTLWDQVRSDMQHSMPRDAFKVHLLGTSAEWLDGGGDPVTLRVWASPPSVPWLVHRYQERAERFAADHTGQPVAIAFARRPPERGRTTRCRVNGGYSLRS
jgi:hypothetical protein